MRIITYFIRYRLSLPLHAVFAPVATILTYETLDEAVELANNTRYGLGASVFGPDQDRCYQLAQRLECGMVAINDFAVYYVSPYIPIDDNVLIMDCPILVESRPAVWRGQSQRLRPIWWS